MGLLPTSDVIFAGATCDVGDLCLRFSRATCSTVPTFLLCWRLVSRPQTRNSGNLTQDQRVFCPEVD